MGLDKAKKALYAWVMYDVSNSAYWTSIVAGFFPIFFKQYWTHGLNVNKSTALLGLANAVAALIVACLSPFLCAIADAGNIRKPMLLLFAYLGAFLCAALFFVGKGSAHMAMTV